MYSQNREMELLKTDEMSSIDRLCAEHYAIPGLVLMENAGRSVARYVCKHWPQHRSVYIFCGRGHNGGDGLVAARHLVNSRFEVHVVLACLSRQLRENTSSNLVALRRMGLDIMECPDRSVIDMLASRIGGHEVPPILIDALLGTGVRGAPRGVIGELVALVNDSRGIKISVDIPTGVNADDGQVPGVGVHANATVTLAYPKRGLFLSPGLDYAGKIEVADIGIPRDIVKRENLDISARVLSPQTLPIGVFRRALTCHKGTFGHLLVIAGSPGFTGAAALACEGALGVGAGLVTLGISDSLNPIMESKLTEVMTLPLPETKGAYLGMESLPHILAFTQGCQGIAVGPGLSRSSETQKLIRELLGQCDLPMVLDADGITAMANQLSVLRSYRGPLILTPHPGELAGLLGTTVEAIQKDRIESARDAAQTCQAIVVLKGAGTVIAEPEGRCWVNPTGNPALASAGTGDVLTGMISGLIVQGVEAISSARLGVYLHGLAADRAVAMNDGVSLLRAGELTKNISSAIRSLGNEYYRSTEDDDS